MDDEDPEWRRKLVESEAEDEDDDTPVDPSDPDIIDSYTPHMDLVRAAREGKMIDTTGMDMLDELFARAFMESFKTSDGTYHVASSPKPLKGVQLPTPRTMKQLMRAIKSNIRNSERGSVGYELAEEAWEVSGVCLLVYCSLT